MLCDDGCVDDGRRFIICVARLPTCIASVVDSDVAVELVGTSGDCPAMGSFPLRFALRSAKEAMLMKERV